MFTGRFVIFGLLAFLMILLIWRNDFSDHGAREWHLCKESLFEQVVFNNCTLIFDGEQRPT